MNCLESVFLEYRNQNQYKNSEEFKSKIHIFRERKTKALVSKI